VNGPESARVNAGSGWMRTFRARLTAWYVAFFVVLFSGFNLVLYGFFSRALLVRVDQTLASVLDTASNMLPDEIDESHGDVAKAAKEVISELQLRGGSVAIMLGRSVLASSGPAGASTSARIQRRWVVWRDKKLEIVAMEPPEAFQADLRLMREIIFIALPLFMGLAAACGYFMTKRNLRPLEVMARQATRITGSNLHARLDPGKAADELAMLAASFNQLLSRLDESFDSMKRFVADASHELRTPLAIIRGEADVALSQQRSAGEYRDSLAVVLEESRKVSRMIDDLLNLARADAGRVALRTQEFYFNDLLMECCRSVQGLAEAGEVTLECPPSPDLPFAADEDLLRRLIVNLLDNAIRYTPRGGRVTAEVVAEQTGVRLRVADTGIGISAEAAPRVFERFYRAENGRAVGGYGLGLPIVKWIAELHGGTVEMESRVLQGSTFTVTLPGAAAVR